METMNWFQRDTLIPITGQAKIANDLIFDVLLPRCLQTNTPHEVIYCPVGDTTNLVLPTLDITWDIILKDAHFTRMPRPIKDTQASAELREAILAGSNFNTKGL